MQISMSKFKIVGVNVGSGSEKEHCNPDGRIKILGLVGGRW